MVIKKVPEKAKKKETVKETVVPKTLMIAGEREIALDFAMKVYDKFD